jgi:hypothetical protein
MKKVFPVLMVALILASLSFNNPVEVGNRKELKGAPVSNAKVAAPGAIPAIAVGMFVGSAALGVANVWSNGAVYDAVGAAYDYVFGGRPRRLSLEHEQYQKTDFSKFDI